MPTYPPNVWNQLKNKTSGDLMKALERDGWAVDITRGAEQIYRHPDGRKVSIHFHPRKTYTPGLLKAILDDIGWTVDEMRSLKLIK